MEVSGVKRDEVDLLQLFSMVWGQRLWMMAPCVVFLGFVLIYVLLKPSKFELALHLYPAGELEYSGVQPSYTGEGELKDGVPDVRLPKLDPLDAFGRAMAMLQSDAFLESFWLSVEGGEGFLQFQNSLEVTHQLSAEGRVVSGVLRLSGGDPERLAQLVSGLLALSSRRSLHLQGQQYVAALDDKIFLLRSAQDQLRESARKGGEDLLALFKGALATAELLGISEGRSQELADLDVPNLTSLSGDLMGYDGLMYRRLYMTGSKALKAEIMALEARRGVDAYVGGLRHLQFLESVLVADRVRVSERWSLLGAYSQGGEVLPPNRPIGVNLPLLVFAALLFGLVLGGVVVSVRLCMQSYRSRGGLQ